MGLGFGSKRDRGVEGGTIWEGGGRATVVDPLEEKPGEELVGLVVAVTATDREGVEAGFPCLRLLRFHRCSRFIAHLHPTSSHLHPSFLAQRSLRRLLPFFWQPRANPTNFPLLLTVRSLQARKSRRRSLWPTGREEGGCHPAAG